MRYLPDSDQMKHADSYTIHTLGIPSLDLMERAAASCVDVLEEKNLDLSNVLVVCGSGNNGGDGFAVARMLIQKGYKVSVLFARGGSPLVSFQQIKENKHGLSAIGPSRFLFLFSL